MKKIFAFILVVLMLCPLLAGCNMSANITNFLYDNEELYTVGNGNISVGDINKIEIDWINGDVKVVYHGLDTIRIVERSEDELNEDMTLHYYANGDKLKIKFASSGEWNFKDIEKELTVYIPQSLMLAELDIDTVDSVVKLTDLALINLHVDTISASVMLDNCNITQNIEVETVSGSIHIDADRINKLDMETVSGVMNITANDIKGLNIETTSGSAYITANDYLGQSDIDTVSGNITLRLSLYSSFTVRFGSVSGRLNSDFDLRKDGNKYDYNGGGVGYKIDTTSGDVTITRS